MVGAQIKAQRQQKLKAARAGYVRTSTKIRSPLARLGDPAARRAFLDNLLSRRDDLPDGLTMAFREGKEMSDSSKRPSSDDITQPKGDKNTRGADTKNGKIGAQPGHERHTRPPYLPEAIDQSHPYELTCCPCCHNPDILFIEDQPPHVIQQAELKEVVVHEEHLAHAYWCESCGQIHYAEFPPEVLKEGLFKARLTALYLRWCHFIAP